MGVQVTKRRWYISALAPSHPKAHHGRVNEHVLVAERALGRVLPDGAEVHHVDEDKQNNANSNLVICQDHSYHYLLHTRARIVRACGDPNTQRICFACKALKPFSEFNASNLKPRTGRLCRACSSERSAKYHAANGAAIRARKRARWAETSVGEESWR